MGKLSIIIRSGTRENDREEPAKQEQQQQNQQQQSQYQYQYQYQYQQHQKQHNQQYNRYQKDKQSSCRNNTKVIISCCADSSSAANSSLLDVCEEVGKVRSGTRGQPPLPRAVYSPKTDDHRNETTTSLFSSFSFCATIENDNSVANRERKELGELQQQVETNLRFHEFEENYEDEVYEPTATATPTSAGHSSRNVLGDEELEIIRRSIVESLGLQRIPDPSKVGLFSLAPWKDGRSSGGMKGAG
ncbi:hypothetical protein HZH66_012879 [Vespula vulgaris]|uniref:Uncharacterized protein n=1 Tax=Vespula vulgaris TaxID=7454 RepID=A0A834J7Z7_VESVU|nr:hypothetical protein HZH66_012879 [Vespula vulgaris]